MPTKKKRTPSPAVVDKTALAKAIVNIIRERQITQTEAAFILRDNPSQVSQVMNMRLRGFSPERLIKWLLLLGQDIDIRLSKGKSKTGNVRVAIR